MYIEGGMILIKPQLFRVFQQAWIDCLGLIVTVSELWFFLYGARAKYISAPCAMSTKGVGTTHS